MLKLFKSFPAVVIIGPRQCGKTFLAKKLKPQWKYFDLESITTYERVSSDIDFFLQKNDNHIIIDEAQVLPQLFNSLRGVIDQNRKQMGRFLITGSSSPKLLKNISESLAGRVAIIELETFKFNEFAEKKLSPFYDIFEHRDINDLLNSDYPISNTQISNFWFFGGYPDVALAHSTETKELWFENYIKNYINRDIQRLFTRLSTQKFQRFLLLLFNLSSTIINKREIANLLDISEPTVKDYLDITDGTFLWRNLTSFEYNIKKTVIKMPKGHIRDTGILHHFLKFSNLEQLDQHPIVGRSFESFVIEEIIKGINATKATSWSYHYYRTKNRAEINLILHGKFGIIPIEIKYGVHTRKKALSALISFVKEHNLKFGILINNAPSIEWITPEVIQIPVGFL